MDEPKYWLSKKYGLIRRAGEYAHPEIWRDGSWRWGSPYVMDAITGMGEDLWSCGEWADKIDSATAEDFANANGIDLHGDNPDPR